MTKTRILLADDYEYSRIRARILFRGCEVPFSVRHAIRNPIIEA